MCQHGIRRTAFSAGSSNSDAVYPYYLIPERGTPVYPCRHSGRGGSTAAERLATCIRKVAPQGFEVFTDAYLKFTDKGRCYFSAVVVECTLPGANLCMAIEIDAPYDSSDFVPLHYLEDRSDARRDDLLVRGGWVVVRFTERQAVEEPLNCTAFVATLINNLLGTTCISVPPNARLRPTPLRKHTRVSAERLAAANSRATYDGTVCIKAEERARHYDINPLTAEEKTYASLLPAGDKVSPVRDNDTAYNAEHRHERDSHIEFFAETHTYLYDGRDVLKSATTLISEYFPAFDMYAAAERKAQKTGQTVQQLTDTWKYAGRKAAETGSFMHKQFENAFLKRGCERTFSFRYTSPTFSSEERIDISKELAMFAAFLRNNGLRPYRTEWNIYDSEKGIAGSPDLVAEYKGRLLMFDWKRSTKLVAPAGNGYRIIEESWGRRGFGCLSALPDNAYVHYSLQQCIYRYLLEKNYGIKLDGMFLVVIHPDYNRYFCLPVKDVSQYVTSIMERL